jgi:hypothetical protein
VPAGAGRRVGADGNRPGSARLGELPGDPRDVPATVDRVRRGHEQGRCCSGIDRAPNGVGRPEDGRLAHEANLEAEGGAVAGQPFDLLGEVAGDEPHAREARARELAEEHRQDGAAVDRQDGFRPTLRQRPEACAFPGRHHDGLHLAQPERADRDEAADTVANGEVAS